MQVNKGSVENMGKKGHVSVECEVGIISANNIKKKDKHKRTRK